MANDAAALCVLLLTQQPLVNLLAALGLLAVVHSQQVRGFRHPWRAAA